MNRRLLVSIIVGIWVGVLPGAFAAVEDQDIPLTAAETQEVHEILDQIKSANPPQNAFFRMRSGLLQLLTNTKVNLGLGADNTMPAIGFEGYFNLYKGIGFEGQYFYAQNLLSGGNSSAKIDGLNIGPRYTFYLDSTHLSDYLALKVFYHHSANNLGSPTAFVINDYGGYALSIERSIPASRKIGVLAALDILKIGSATSVSALEPFSPDGIGFTVKGEIYFRMDWFKTTSHLGASYWQQSYSNTVGFTSDGSGLRAQANKNAYFLLSRSLWLSYTLLF